MQAFLKENRGFIAFLICFGFFRLAIADWNPIPSGSMRPTILEGDVVLVDRLAYDLKLPLSDISVLNIASPQRGDVVTFSSPTDGTRLIKRLIAIPGDVVEVRKQILYINGAAADYDGQTLVTEHLSDNSFGAALRVNESSNGNTRTVQFLPVASALQNFGPMTVPKDSYFFLGDNRDNSSDSRVIGVVHRHLLIGRAHHVLLSANINEDWVPRIDRFGKTIR